MLASSATRFGGATIRGAKYTLAAVMIAGSLGACASQGGGGTVDRYDVGAPARVAFGRVIEVTPVEVRGTDGGTGTVFGAATGAAIGVGAASDGAESVIAGILGALIGGVAGNAIERGVTSGNGFEYLIRLENGETIALVQLDEYAIREGTPVRITYGEDVRVTPTGGRRGGGYDDRYGDDRYVDPDF